MSTEPNTTPEITNEDSDVIMESDTESDNIATPKNEEVVQIPIEGCEQPPDTKIINVATHKEDEEKQPSSSSPQAPECAVTVIDPVAAEKAWEEELDNLVKRLKNGKTSHQFYTHIFLTFFFYCFATQNVRQTRRSTTRCVCSTTSLTPALTPSS